MSVLQPSAYSISDSRVVRCACWRSLQECPRLSFGAVGHPYSVTYTASFLPVISSKYSRRFLSHARMRTSGIGVKL